MNPHAHTQTLPRASGATVLACGAFLKNRACLLDGDRVHWSALHGDLVDASSRVAMRRSVETLIDQARTPVQAVAHDLHPDFPSSALALELADRFGVPTLGVQHHHAHVGVALAARDPAGPVVGIAIDGFGLGPEGGAWGGEILWVAPDGARWRRLAHLAPLRQPGGDTAAREPWRVAAAVLHAVGRSDEIVPRFSRHAGKDAACMVQTMLARDLHCPSSTSAGRWFDAAAGALGLSVRQAHEAEAAIALERSATAWLDAHPDFNVEWPSLDLGPLVAELFDLRAEGGEAIARGAARFHLALADALARHAAAAAACWRTDCVVLSGGCLGNGILRRALHSRFERAGLRVAEPGEEGCGDAGLALGQAWVAAAQLRGSTTPSVDASVAMRA